MISVENVRKTFGNSTLLKNISFSMIPGERISIIGPGGCGKSTLLKIILGLEKADEGQIRLLGTDMQEASDQEKRQTLRKVGMAFQQGALFDFMTVRENLIFAMENMTEKNIDQMDETVKRLLGGVKLLRTVQQFPYELSGGMQRRVGITRALATDPTVAIFDEPTSGLDPVTSTIILDMIHKLGGADQGNTLVVATSNVEIAIRFARRIVIINEGEVVADGDWKELLLDGSEWVRHFLGVRLIGLDIEYARGLDLPDKFIQQHWS